MNKKELKTYLRKYISNGTGAYFIVKYNKRAELLWFSKHKDSNNSDWYLEAPCTMNRIKADTKEAQTYFMHYGYVIKEDNYAYEIDSLQVSPFLPEEVEIEFLGDTEAKAVDWMLENTYANHKWNN